MSPAQTSSSTLSQGTGANLVARARLPGMRALAWEGNALYASSGYRLLRAAVEGCSADLNWQEVGTFRAPWRRRFTVSSRLTARLFRDGFHALAVLPSGGLVAAVPGAILTLRLNQKQFRQTFRVKRGSRPLHVTAVPGGDVFWGEYFDNASRDEVHIYGSHDGGMTWNVAYTFAKDAIRHVHNIVYDCWQDCLWVLTGDYGAECRILRASCDFSRVEVVLQGKQQARAVAAIPTREGLYFASDTPLEQNSICHLSTQGKLSRLAAISSSSLCGCRAASTLFFSTMVEPSEVNRDQNVRVYAGSTTEPEHWPSLLNWRKDGWSMKFFQYGNAFLPDGNNTSQCLALTTIAVECDDMVTSIYSVNS
jgi:hypothetical protein